MNSLQFSSTWLVIVNPAAGNGAGGRLWPKASAMLTECGLSYHHEVTQHIGHATTIALEAMKKGYRKIAVLGGDGTANEAINGIMQSGHSSEAIFALIPGGTGNDWIKTYGIKNSYKYVIELMALGTQKRQDIGIAKFIDPTGQQKKRHFFNVAGMGYDAYVTKVSNEIDGKWAGKLFFWWLIAKCLGSYRKGSAQITWETNERHVGPVFSINAGICKYNGGGANFCPHARPDDGMLALTIVGDITSWDVVKNTHLIYNGKILSHPRINGFQTQQIKIEGLDGHTIGLELDGEYVGNAPLEINIIPNALWITAP